MDYYQIARKASREIGRHEGLIYLQNLCQKSHRVLDVGCGEGSRLNILLAPRQRGWGIDPNPAAISLAKSHHPKHYFKIGPGEKIPYQDNNFDVVYSAFAIEHCSRPEIFVREMIRVCKPNGCLVILAPNYGAPNRRSPNSIENPYNKFFEGVIKDFFPYPGLDWHPVIPQRNYSEIDADTTREPYLKSLICYLKSLGLNIENYSSLWTLEIPDSNIRQLVIRYLGQLGISPFKFWGPQLFVCAKKTSQTTVPKLTNTTV